LSAVLAPAEPIADVEILHAEPERALAGNKPIALDVRIRLANGEQVDVEMQTQRRPALAERLLYYWARLYAGQLSRGEDYTELRRCAVVLFAAFPMLGGSRFHSTFSIFESSSGELLSPHLAVHVIELPKMDLALAPNEPALSLWGRFLAATTDEELEALAMDNPVFKQAKEALETLSDDPKARIQAEMRETALLALKLDIGTSWHQGRRQGLVEGKAEGRMEGKAEGRMEGKAEGRMEGKAEALRGLLVLKFGPLSAESSARIQAASEQQLDAATRRLLGASDLADVLSTLPA
jgi:predicted transposase/invertase (TIGR01784 family)